MTRQHRYAFVARGASCAIQAFGFLLVLSAVASPAQAAAPEIDPGSAGNAVALVVGGLVLITATRWRR